MATENVSGCARWPLGEAEINTPVGNHPIVGRKIKFSMLHVETDDISVKFHISSVKASPRGINLLHTVS